jgi:hypothetical protein
MSLRLSLSMKEDGPSFIFNDFIVTALAPRLNLIQAALQLSENITLFAIRGMHTNAIGKEGQMNSWCLLGGGGGEFTYILYNVEDRMDP